MIRKLSLGLFAVLCSALLAATAEAQYTGGVSFIMRPNGSVVGNGITFQQGNTATTILPNGHRHTYSINPAPVPVRPAPAPRYAPVQGVKPYQPYPRMDQLGR